MFSNGSTANEGFSDGGVPAGVDGRHTLHATSKMKQSRCNGSKNPDWAKP